MTEARRSYRINNLTQNEINFVLQLLADRLDELEGRRGTPMFKADVVMDGNRITDVGTPVASTDAAIKGDVDSSISSITSAQTGFLNKAGIGGGQVAYGGTNSGDSLILYGTTNTTKGWVGYADPNTGTILIGWKG